jgi:CHASE2 domain-containing sensor protein
MFGVAKITDLKLFQAFDPISTALQEFELTDYVFSRFRTPPVPDPRIVLVNIGSLSRREMAQQIQIISQYHPKVIGIDGFYNCEGGFRDTVNCRQLLDTLGNLMLANAIKDAGNVVLVSRLLQKDATSRQRKIDVYDSMEFSDPMFNDYAHNGFANLVTGATYQEDVKICKTFIPQMVVNGKKQLAFSVMMAMMYDSTKAKKLLARNNEEETINFRGNFEIPDVKIRGLRDQMDSTSAFRTLCYAIDWMPLLNGDYLPSMFENSIVIFGFLGNQFGDPSWNDKFFTPLNIKVAGRANPDMFGVVIHANIVAMILNEDYVNEIGLPLQIIIAIVVCFLNVLLFYWMDSYFPTLYDGLSVVIQIIEILIVSLTIIFSFAYFNIKLELTLTIAAVALIGPCYDVYKSVENTVIEKLTLRSQKV